MKNLLIVVLVLVVAAIGLAYWQGWFDPKRGDDGKINLNINKKKFSEDMAKFKKDVGDQAKAAKEKLANLREKAKSHTGADKEKLVKEIEELQADHDKLEVQIKAVEDA